MNTLDLLLKTNLNALKLPEMNVKINRLSEATGEDVIFTVRALRFDNLEELRECNEKNSDFQAMVLLNGVASPDLKSPELKEKLNAGTPVETVKKLLLAGEIEDLYVKISKLSGFGADTIEEIKKK